MFPYMASDGQDARLWDGRLGVHLIYMIKIYAGGRGFAGERGSGGGQGEHERGAYMSKEAWDGYNLVWST